MQNVNIVGRLKKGKPKCEYIGKDNDDKDNNSDDDNNDKISGA